MQMTSGKNVTLFWEPSVQQRNSRQRPSHAMYSERRTAPFSSLKLLARQHVTSPLRNVCFEGTTGTTFSFPERISPCMCRLLRHNARPLLTAKSMCSPRSSNGMQTAEERCLIPTGAGEFACLLFAQYTLDAYLRHLGTSPALVQKYPFITGSYFLEEIMTSY